MDINLNKIKFLVKENKADIFYVAAMVLVIGLTILAFIWSVNIVLTAVNAAFAIIPQNVSSEILSFDLNSFGKISKRLDSISQIPQNPESAPIISTSTAETATSTIAIDISKINLEILNGTTISGLAKDWKSVFVAAGFAEANIKTNNADKKDYSGVNISYNASNETLEKIAAVLKSGNLPISSSKDVKLSENSFIIIIGK